MNLPYAAILALALCACAKEPKTGLNDGNKLFFESWIHVYHPDAVPSTMGSYVIAETPGGGTAAGTADANPFVRVQHVIRDLDGTLQSTSRREVAQREGSFAEGNYYGPVVWPRGEGHMSAGLDDAIAPMRTGGSRTLAVPGWLNTTPDIKKWETDSLARYVVRTFPGKSAGDTLKYGFYYLRTEAPSSEKDFPADTTIYINYVGRMLDGHVFDTNVKDSAKFYGIYSASRTYAPSSVTWFGSDGKYSDIKLGGSSVIDGFAYALSKMHPHEKGTAVFYSGIGYGSSGSGSTIPAYAPLRFDIEIVDKP